MLKIINIPTSKRKIVPREDFLIMVMRSVETDRIILPKDLKEGSEVVRFETVIIGPKVKDIKVGDCCIVSPQAMIRFRHESQDYFVTREENVTAITRKEETA